MGRNRLRPDAKEVTFIVDGYIQFRAEAKDEDDAEVKASEALEER